MNRQNDTHGARIAPHLGIDIGRVLICPTADDGRADTSFLGSSDEDAVRTPPAPLAFETVASLVERFSGNVWLVSKAGPRIQALTRRWLEHQDFYRRSGVPRAHVRFCRRRPEKRDHAAALGLTHFIDDRRDVLAHLLGLVPNLYLFGWQAAPAPPWATPVLDWSAVAGRLLGEGDEARGHVLGEPHAIVGPEERLPRRSQA